MDGLQELLQNDILWAGILSWFTAQVVKTILYAVLNKTLDFTRLVGDGGMPSAHSATVTAVAAMTGLSCGFGSPLFAVACIVAIIVMHDAMGVRLETSKQAKLLNEMVALFEALGQPKLSMEKTYAVSGDCGDASGNRGGGNLFLCVLVKCGETHYNSTRIIFSEREVFHYEVYV